jgi:hypothetical protein
MAQGGVDHPSYLTRQAIGVGVSTAGANGTSGGRTFISDMRVRKAAVAVRVAGTSAGAGNAANLIYIGTVVTGFNTGAGFTLTTATGTNTVGTIALGSSLANAVTTSTDMNTRLVAGGLLQLKNGTDATGTYDVTIEAYIDPAGQWTGPNN